MPVFQGQVGTQGVADGTYPNVRMDKFGSMVVTELNPRYYEQGYRGNVFVAANQATGVFTAVSLTATGFILSNPAGSGKNLVILEILFSVTVPLAAASIISLYANVNPVATATSHTAALVVRPILLGSSTVGVGLADSSATLPATPVAVRTICSGGAGAPTITTICPF